MTRGERIKQRRKELGMTADELGKKIGKTRATIYRYENGDIEDMPITVLQPLAKALKTTPEYLMGWELDKNTVQELQDPLDKAYIACLADMHFGSGVQEMLLKYDTLNDIGKKKVQDNVDDLSKIYKKPEFLAPILNAAHERTDIEITPEMRKHDDDIMNDPNF